MMYQIDGKNVKEQPKGKFAKIVVIPGKLKNFITKEGHKEVSGDFWIRLSFKGFLRFIFTICKHWDFWMHIAIVKDNEDDYRIYINGKELKG